MPKKKPSPNPNSDTKPKPDSIFKPLPPKPVRALHTQVKDGVPKIVGAVMAYSVTTKYDGMLKCKSISNRKNRKSSKVNYAPANKSHIKNYAFYNKINLRNVRLSAIRSIGDSAFSNCHNLRNIHLAGSIQKLGSNIFFNCDKVYIHYSGTTKQWNQIEKKNDWSNDCKLIIVYCSDGKIEIK